MSYLVKEIFYTLQGEGAHTGRAAVFCRFAGCNFWSGREEDRHRGRAACAAWCDTDFVGGTKYATPEQLVSAVRQKWVGVTEPWVVLTGGEPLLQVDEALVLEFKKQGFFVCCETNGSVNPPPRIDWLTVSPKLNGPLRVKQANELKVVYPHGLDPKGISVWASIKSVQPLDGPHRAEAVSACIRFCLENPDWRLSSQQHKAWGIP